MNGISPAREDRTSPSASPRVRTPTEVARLGPNSLIQTAGALVDREGEAEARRLLALAGFGGLVDHPPESMVEEERFHTMVAFLEGALGVGSAEELLLEAGRRTGHYVLQHRIPRVARVGLRVTPRALRLRLLLEAIQRHAWTFTGSATFTFDLSQVPVVALRHGPAGRRLRSHAAVHAYYQGAFEVLLATLFDREIQLVEESLPGASPREGVQFRIFRSARS